jgi:osmotically-inducible protein OsmY
MKSDTEIMDDVIDELRWDPQITEPDAIGVAVTDGAVTLTGSVPTYAQKLVAARAAERVYGVKAVANDLKVEGGWVTLDGEVEWGFQRHEVERMVRQVRGVIGVTDTIVVKPSASPQSVQAVIKETFKREAEIDARHVRVEVSDHTAKLYGHVHSLQEANAARAAAAAARGISRVESHLVISP